MIEIDTNHPITNKAISTWGEAGQIAILQEESGEVVTAIARYNRKRVTSEKIAEEIADFIVSSMSVIPMLNIEDLVKKYMETKIKRLNRRIEEHGK